MACTNATTMTFRVYEYGGNDPSVMHDTGKEFTINYPKDTSDYWNLVGLGHHSDYVRKQIDTRSICGVMFMKVYGFNKYLTGWEINTIGNGFMELTVFDGYNYMWNLRRVV